MTHDIAILGSGPSGLSLGSILCDRGFDVAMFSPNYYDTWKNNYGVWQDELSGWDLPDGFSEIWTHPRVRCEGETLTLDRTYARLNNAGLQAAWRSSLRDENVYKTKVSTISHKPDHSTIMSEFGEVKARLVIDARGATGRKGKNTAAQTAFGALMRVDGDPLGGAGMMIMDWQDTGMHDVPSFMYGMRLGDAFFLEETVLAGRPAVPIEELKHRLFMRLERMGVRVIEVMDEERCFIPLNLPIPPSERTLAVGAAASFVHPATGYSIGRSLATGLKLAASLEELWSEDLDAITAAASNVIWPERARATRRFYELGLEVLLKLDPERLPLFFHSFFEAPDSLWRGYLSDTGSVGDVAQLMWRVFRNVDADMKWQLARHASMAALLRRARMHK